MKTKEFNNVLREANEIELTNKKYYHRGFEDCRKQCLIEMKKLTWQDDTWATHTIRDWFITVVKNVKEKK